MSECQGGAPLEYQQLPGYIYDARLFFHLIVVAIALKEAVEAADIVVAAQNVPRSCLIALHTNAMPCFWYR